MSTTTDNFASKNTEDDEDYPVAAKKHVQQGRPSK